MESGGVRGRFPFNVTPLQPHTHTRRSGVSFWRRYLAYRLTKSPWGLLSSYTLSDPLLYDYVQCCGCHIRVVNDQ